MDCVTLLPVRHRAVRVLNPPSGRMTNLQDKDSRIKQPHTRSVKSSILPACHLALQVLSTGPNLKTCPVAYRHEGHGSILACLKAKGWATALSAGEGSGSFSARSFFNVCVSLTDKGMRLNWAMPSSASTQCPGRSTSAWTPFSRRCSCTEALSASPAQQLDAKAPVILGPLDRDRSPLCVHPGRYEKQAQSDPPVMHDIPHTLLHLSYTQDLTLALETVLSTGAALMQDLTMCQRLYRLCLTTSG